MAGSITALQVQKKNQDRVNVYLDGVFAFGLARIVAAWLYVGQALSDEKIAELRAADEHEAAYQRALKYLGYRDRSEAEVRRHLTEHQVPEETVEATISRLQRSGLLSDKRFTRIWVDNRTEFRPRGKRALAYELRQKGIDAETIDQALEPIDEEDMAYRAALKPARRYLSLTRQEFRQKVCAFLARRGFDYEVAATTATRLWAEIDSERDTAELDREVDP
jgi:regulatory protein